MKSIYDFIIVGGGTAGCVLANRLSENSANHVLVIEAGRREPWWDIRLQMPAALSMLLGNPRYDWCFETEPEPFLDHRRLAHARGKVLGGSSSINGMIFQRGNPLDYAAWAALPGLSHWDYAHCIPYFKRMETSFAAASEGGHIRANHQNDRWTYRGLNGPLAVQRGSQEGPLVEAFFSAAQQAGYDRVSDLNGFQQEGFCAFDRTVYRGLRQSASRAYYRPVKHRKNLTLMCQTDVTHLISRNSRVVGVGTMQRGNQASIYGKHIILAAGAFNSPALMQRSGYGPESVLRHAGVDVIAHLPGVGENLQDHLEVYVQHRSALPVTQQPILSPKRWPFMGLNWLVNRKGPASTNHFEVGGFIRSSPQAISPDIMIHFLPLAVRYDGSSPVKGHGYQVHVGPTLSDARGSVWIRRADYRVPPAFRFNYLSTQSDREQWVSAIRKIRTLMSQPAWKQINAGEISPGPAVSDDSNEILAWVRREAETALHPAGTCKMGVDPMAVVNPKNFSVYGVPGLYVVDASIMPLITNANLSSPVYMMAERASDALLGNTPLPAESVPFFQRKTMSVQTDGLKADSYLQQESV